MKKPARSPHRRAKRVPHGARRSQDADFVIDKEIASLIPSLSPEELAQLERSILAEGCREPLSVWDDGRKTILLDGHNRHSICGRHGLAYEIKLVKLPDREAAIRWVAEHQLGRRNLTPEAYSYLRGKLYNGMKRQGARSDLTSGQSAQKSTTAQQLAAECKVDEKTIRRDGRFAAQLDALADAVGVDIRDDVLTRGARISRADVPRLLRLDEQARRRVIERAKQGTRASALLREARRGAEGNVREEPDRTQHGVDRARRNATVDFDGALEQLALVDAALCTASPGILSQEQLARAGQLLKALGAALDAHRRAAAPRQDRPRADLAGAVEAAVELQKIVIADKVLEIAGLGLEELREGEALVAPLAETARAMARLSRPDCKRRRSAPQRRGAVPTFVKALQPILPPNSTLAQRHGDVLRVFEVFDLAGKYLSKIEPAIELAYNHHAPMRTDNPASAAICDAIERYIDHGRAFVAGQYTFIHYLEDYGVPPALFRDAQATFVREVKEGTRMAFDSLGEKLRPSPSPAQNAPTPSSSIQLPITAPLDEPAFKELCEIVEDCIAAMYQGCDVLAKIYQGRPVPPDIQKVWHDAFDRAQQCRPLLDGTFTHADHMRAWGAHASSYVAVRAAEVTTEARAIALPDAAAAPASSQTSPVPEKPTNKQWAEYEVFCQGYAREMVPPEGVLAELEKKDWPEVLKERARRRITGGWQIVTSTSTRSTGSRPWSSMRSATRSGVPSR